MKPTCPERDALLSLLDGDAGDPLWNHVAACPRCRSLIAAFRLFAAEASAGAPVRPGEDAAAERLSRVLDDRINGASRRRRPGIDWSARLRRMWVPALGGAMVLVGALLLIRNEGPAPLDRRSVVRGSQPSAGISGGRVILADLPPVRRDDGGMEIRWRTCRSADSYAVRVLDAGFHEIARISAGTDTLLVLTPEKLRPLLESGGTYWMAVATIDGDPVAETVPSPLPDLQGSR